MNYLYKISAFVAAFAISLNLNYKAIVLAIVFMVFDIVTGLAQSFVNGTFDSAKMRKGGKNKIILVLAIVMGVLLEVAVYVVGNDIGLPSIPFSTLICTYIIFMEIMSCIENIEKGYPGAIPAVIRKTLAQSAESILKGDDLDE